MTKTGRAKSLEYDIGLALKQVAKGAPRYFQTRQYILAALIEDLKAINHLVPRLDALRVDIVKKLILLWKKRGNSIKTIQSKVSVLRRVCGWYQPNLYFPTNEELDIKKTHPHQSTKIPFYQPEQLQYPEIRNLCTLQYYFGLTKSEALHFVPYMASDHEIRLPRKITYNSRDRVIAIQTEPQRKCLQLIQNDPGFKKKKAKKDIKTLAALFSYHLNQVGIKDQDYYRHYYVKERYEGLSQAGLNRRLVLRQLRAETGYRTNRPLLEILKCLNVF